MYKHFSSENKMSVMVDLIGNLLLKHLFIIMLQCRNLFCCKILGIKIPLFSTNEKGASLSWFTVLLMLI